MERNEIRRVLLVVSLACLAAACSPEPGTASAGVVPAADAVAAGDASMAVAAGSADRRRLPTRAMARGGFAGLPDRGDLVAYPDEPVVRRAGPYTWHRADVSEAHALRAIMDGVLTITAPSGQQLRFAYDRHVEHASGDWTWIGHVAGGSDVQDAILTFGGAAVFGSVAQPGGAPLKLVMADGASWLVETDAAALLAQPPAWGRHRPPDFLLPPELPPPSGVQGRAAAVQGAAAAMTATVDVVVGYTNGFAAQFGTTNARQQVLTRLNHLVEIANESYVNSEVDGRVRLVHAMEVAYTDSNDNSIALRELTGSDGTEQPQPSQVALALRPLHQAREQYGADLVSVVRRFQHPEATTCGVAWLLGGGQRFLHTDYDVYGMSVVSDGSDGGYFCEDTTFAHELGHNMGLAHDVETARGEDGVLDDEDYGRYPWSFGYRTGPAQGDFYTVMAYSDEQANGYRVFSNPDITTCGGFACGIEGQADNARTLRDTMPIVGSFRATVVPEEPEPPPVPENPRILLKDIDVNGDRLSDLLFFNHVEDRLTFWIMDGPTRVATFTQALSGTWRLVDSGDMDRDRDSDLLFTNDARQLLVGISDGSRYAFTTMPHVYSTSQTPIGLVDVNGDYRNDIVIRDTVSGRLSIWYMHGATRGAFNAVDMSRDLSFVGHADMNRDRFDEMLWVDPQRNVWVSIGVGLGFETVPVVSKSGAQLAHSAEYDVMGLQDINGDYRHDIILHSEDLDRLVVWYMDGATRNAYNAHPTTPGLRLTGKGNYDGGRFRGFIWEDPATGAMEMMRSTGFQFVRTDLPYLPGPNDWLMDVE